MEKVRALDLPKFLLFCCHLKSFICTKKGGQ